MPLMSTTFPEKFQKKKKSKISYDFLFLFTSQHNQEIHFSMGT